MPSMGHCKKYCFAQMTPGELLILTISEKTGTHSRHFARFELRAAIVFGKKTRLPNSPYA